MENIENQIYELEKEIALLPSGSITTKKINNNVYFYQRIYVNGKRKENYINKDLAQKLESQIKHRKELEKKVKELKTYLPYRKFNKDTNQDNTNSFRTYVRIGDELKRYASQANLYKRRKCFNELRDFIYDNLTEKILILYGLRRTGKTILIRQILADMSEDVIQRSAFIQIKYSSTLADINADLKQLESNGYKYVFIDEVTQLNDFIDGSALFSDIFAASGMKIVLSGTDSLGFAFSEDEQLFDRCVMIHTTFIPYQEFENVLGIKGIDEYIRYGGTMSLSGINYNDNSIFSNSKKTNEYIDIAIAKNIQHSLKRYQNGSHFRSLEDLYDKDELTNVINRVIEDMNHKFAIETLTRTFESNDLSISARNMRQDKLSPNDILDHIDIDKLTKNLKNSLDILNKEEQTISISNDHVKQIKEYLKYLDLIKEIDIRYIPDSNKKDTFTVITQPGIRYIQALELVNNLNKDKLFESMNVIERNSIIQRIKNEIKGRMMEEIVLLETKLAKPKMQIFKLQFAIGEFDMVIFNPQELTCEIYEIKHSTEVNPAQYRYLIDDEKCLKTEHQYGAIKGRHVIYRGETHLENNVNYLNVEEYLKNLYV